MDLRYSKDISTSLALFFLKITGFWVATTRVQKWLSNSLVIYSVSTVVFCMWVQIRGLYFTWGDFVLCAEIAGNTAGVIMCLFKLLSVYIRKEKFLSLIVYMKQHFWHSNYDDYEKEIIGGVKQMCIYFVCVFSFFSQATLILYTIKPAITNIGKNDSDRSFIFNMWLDFPLTKTPYYEITYVVQALTTYHVGVCYLCFDNIFCIMCLHVCNQFQILQYRIGNINRMQLTMKDNKIRSSYASSTPNECFVALKNCIRHHQALIEFCTTMEQVFTEIMLGQVLTFSVLICINGYQIVLVDLNVEAFVSVTCYIITNMCQLWMFTYSCDVVTRESAGVAPAAYGALWTNLPMDELGKIVRKNVQFIIARSKQPCYLTACGFFPISLETYTGIMSTAMSYFTLLKQSTVDAVEI